MTVKDKKAFGSAGQNTKKNENAKMAAVLLGKKDTKRVSFTLDTDMVGKLDTLSKLIDGGRGARDMLVVEAVEDLFKKYLAGKGEHKVTSKDLVKKILED